MAHSGGMRIVHELPSDDLGDGDESAQKGRLTNAESDATWRCNALGDFANARRCEWRDPAPRRCQSAAMRNGHCPMHRWKEHPAPNCGWREMAHASRVTHSVFDQNNVAPVPQPAA